MNIDSLLAEAMPALLEQEEALIKAVIEHRLGVSVDEHLTDVLRRCKLIHCSGTIMLEIDGTPVLILFPCETITTEDGTMCIVRKYRRL